MNNRTDKLIKGINVCNPVDVEKDYLLYTVEYAHKYGFNHIQINGPIHSSVKGNIDGMTMLRKYERFNDEKNKDYVTKSLDAVNAACEKAYEYGIKMYMWHHELELPVEFKNVYPEILNSYGDIEITHPLVRDFLENKIADFFCSYPKMDGIVLTLHETRIPVLKLKDQKLGPIERIKYITQIIYESCQKHGKELIVRPFASTDEDCGIMAKAYQEISENLPIMNKWTQFDWSLTAPSNRSLAMIKNNPLMIEADIYGEFFGRGYFPMMLKNHLKEKFEYCGTFNPIGYVSRIDRDGRNIFGDVNEVNIAITKAYLNSENADKAIDDFFMSRYPDAAAEIRELMEKTEDILIKTLYLNGFYFNSQSFLPPLNHSKNHYYFELVRSDYNIDSNEWFIPREYERGSIESLIEEKESAVACAQELFDRFTELKPKIKKEDYEELWCKFASLRASTRVWALLLKVFIAYVKYFETRDEKYIESFEHKLEMFLYENEKAAELLGDKYCALGFSEIREEENDYEGNFAEEIRNSFYKEKEETEMVEKEDNLLDYIVCGGAMEGHLLQKEVNFSDTLINENMLCRIAGSARGGNWCAVNAHGWFSYLVNVKPNSKNIIKITAGALSGRNQMTVSIGGESFTIDEETNAMKEFVFEYTEKEGRDSARIRFEKVSIDTPCVYLIKIYG